MKIIFKLAAAILGLYLMYEGFNTYTFTTRSSDGSMGIYTFVHLYIPATDFYLHTYGISFFLTGTIVTLIPFLGDRRMKPSI